MTLKQQLTNIKTSLDKWATNENGGALIAFDHVHLWHLLLHKPGAPRAVCVYEGEDAKVPFEGASRLGRVNRHFSVTISRGRGLNLERGASLTDGAGGGRPMYDLVSEAVEIIRKTSAVADDGDGPIDYHGTHRVDGPNGMIVDAYQIDFSAGTQLEQLRMVENPPN